MIINRLCEQFRERDLGKGTCLKFMYYFNKMEVNVYFDGYDEDLPHLALLLKYQGEYSFLLCNIEKLSEKTFECSDIKEEIKEQMLCGGSFQKFTECLMEQISTEEFILRNYKSDLAFKCFAKQGYEEKGILPFFGGFQKGNMRDWEVERFHSCFPISKEALLFAKKKGYKMITVYHCKDRKKIRKEWEKLEG